MDFSIDDTITELTGLVRDMGEQLVTDDSLRELDARFGPGTESGSGGGVSRTCIIATETGESATNGRRPARHS